MQILTPDADPDAFFAQVAAARRRVLLLDYDGTLAPFVADRDRAFPYAEVKPLLAELFASAAMRCVVVSGRAVADIVRLIGVEPLPEIWGNHGWERRTPDGAYLRTPLDCDTEALLRRAEAGLRQCTPAERVEIKPVSLAAHWRGLPQPEADALREAVLAEWGGLIPGSRLELHEFDGGVELRVLGRNKADAVREVLGEEGANTAAAYLGDDRTDEDAFAAMAGRGLSVLVRKERRDTRADLWITPPEELVQFLRRWQTACA